MSFRALEDLWWKVRWSSRATALFHVFAMYSPFNAWRLFFYRLRGVRIGKNVYIVQGSFLEESRPWLITIEDDVRIGAGVTIVTHDAIYHNFDTRLPIRYGPVILKKGCILAPRSTILPGVCVGERSLVAPGAVVLRDVPAGTIVSGPTAAHLMNTEDGLERFRARAEYFERIATDTKYPWRMHHNSSSTEQRP
jgi:acetyltransferase-like isoleucine patch superfamily enzyme